MSNLSFNFSESPFEAIKRIENGIEFWYARELMSLLGYKKWERFNDVIEIAIENLKTLVDDASVHASLYWEASGRTKRANYKLSRLACYHIALCCDSRGNDAVKMAKHYFAVKTRQAELSEALPPSQDSPEAVLGVIDLIFKGVPIKPELIAGVKLNAAKQLMPTSAAILEPSRQLLIVNSAQEFELLTVTEIGKRLDGMSARKVNQMLIDKGFQVKNPNKKSSKDSSYLPTPLGSEFSDLTLATGSNGSGTFQQLRWYFSIVDQLV